MSARVTLWAAASIVAGLGTWTLWSAAPGVNWGVWTIVAAAGGVACGGFIGGQPGIRVGLCTVACALAAGAAVTADPLFHVLIFVGVTWLFALAAYVADDPRGERIGLALSILAPVVTMPLGVVEAGRRVGELTMIVGTERHRPVLRGSILASVVVVIFALILAGADPILAALRDDLIVVLERLEFIPRLVFFCLLLVGAVGSYGMAQRPVSPSISSRPSESSSRTETERVIVLSAVALLFAAFLGLQVSYLFGNAPARVGSGVTFAEYARRGFAELSVVAGLCTLLILWLERGPRRGAREQGLAFLLTVLLWILLVSAFRRLWLYEEAYGFTTARLYAQIYMVLLASGLVLLVIELVRGLHAGRFLRMITMAGLVTLVVLSLWNHEGWIARQNIERAAHGGPLDASYLVWNLSANAVPAIVASLDRTPLAEVLGEALIARYTRRMRIAPCRWFEWNLRQVQAANALYAARLVTGEVPGPGIVAGCVRLVRQ